MAVTITLAGPLLLFNPWLTSALQQRHQVAAELGTTQAEIDRVTGAILADIYVNGPFDAALDGQEPLLDERERSHMADVSRLVQVLAAVAIMGLVLVGVAGSWLRRERRRQGRVMLIASGSVGLVALVLAVVFSVAFEPAFLAFHAIFFPPGTYLFAPGSQLIVLFPDGFWFDATLLAGLAVILTALIVTLIGYARWRGASGDAPPALI